MSHANLPARGYRTQGEARKTPFTEGLRRILSVVATLRQQGRNVLGHLVEACQARLFGEAAPSLLHRAVAQPPDRVPKG